MRLCSISGLLLLICISGWAVPVQWTLAGVTLGPPSVAGTASGSFVYDSDTNSYSNIDITTTAFTFTLNSAPVSVPSQHYTTVTQGTSSYLTAGNANGAGLTLIFTQPLNNAGGTVGFAPSLQVGPTSFIAGGEGIPTSQWAPGGSGPLVGRSITQGSLAGAVLPPATPAGAPSLSSTGLVALGILLVGCAAKLLRNPLRAES